MFRACVWTRRLTNDSKATVSVLYWYTILPRTTQSSDNRICYLILSLGALSARARRRSDFFYATSGKTLHVFLQLLHAGPPWFLLFFLFFSLSPPPPAPLNSERTIPVGRGRAPAPEDPIHCGNGAKGGRALACVGGTHTKGVVAAVVVVKKKRV